ncbi:hypothetical protein QYY66_20740, partial [Xanthomonas campestris pv. campestris]|nr:hypothetical protein [Xanthomonas campestris pv. campestris]
AQVRLRYPLAARDIDLSVSLIKREGPSPRQLHRAQARSYVTCTAITDGSHSHACNASAKQAKLRRLV